MTKITGFSRKSKSKIIYPTCKSVLRPVPYRSNIPVPSPPSGDVEPVLRDEPSCSDESEDTEIYPSFKDESKPLFINQKRLNDLVRDLYLSAPSNSRLNVVVRSPAPFGLGQNGCWPSRESQLPRALPFIFSLCCPLNDRRREAHIFFKIGRLFSLFLFSCPPLAFLRLLILLLLLMSGNVHPNPGPIFPCFVCAGNVTWRGKSVQCCACSKWVHLRCSQLSLSKFRALGSSHSWSFPPAESL